MANIAPKARERKHSIEDLRRAFDCDFDAGVLTWKHRDGLCNSWNSKWPGKRAGSKRKDGYTVIRFDNKQYLAHQIIWALFHNKWVDEIDHRHGVSNGDSIDNLRESTRAQNNSNRSRQKNNTSGDTGVVWLKNRNKWAARISSNKKTVHLGVFLRKEDAVAAYKKASEVYHGEFSHLHRREALP